MNGRVASRRRIYDSSFSLFPFFYLRYNAIVLGYKREAAGGKVWTYGTP